MKLSTCLSYTGDVFAGAVEIRALEEAGLDGVWVPEGYSYDAFTTMGFLASQTHAVTIGSGVVNVYSRTPTVLAMSFAGLDMLSNGRAMCGIGASGPQVIEGFHGIAYEHPLQRIVETIEICRATWRRELVDHHGPTIDIPLPDGVGTGLGKPLKLINHPVRDAIPVWWASLVGRSVEKTAELADGWIPASFIPERSHELWGDSLARGRATRSPQLAPLQVLAGGPLKITRSPDEVTAFHDRGRLAAALYLGGMGAKSKNFYNDLLAAYGWGREAQEIQSLFLSGEKERAAAAVPLAYLEATSLVGPVEYIRDRVAAYQEAGVTHLQTILEGPLEEKVSSIATLKEILEG